MRKNFPVNPWFYPLPVLIIGTYDENGKPDAMNAAWGGLYDSDLVEICLSSGHKTTKNILKKKAFTVAFGTADTVAACDYVGLVSANNVGDKMQRSGFTTTKSAVIDAPIINELPLALECKLEKVTEDGNVIGKIVNICADESILDENGEIDYKKLRPISYEPVKNEYVVMGESVGKAFSEGKKLK